MSKGMIEELSGEMKKDLLRAIPANRFGEVEQLGALIEYLMGPDADYMTGQVLNLNGACMAVDVAVCADKCTPRLQYTLRFVFGELLNWTWELHTKRRHLPIQMPHSGSTTAKKMFLVMSDGRARPAQRDRTV